MPNPVHRPDTSDTGSAAHADRCVCGAEIVFYEPPLLDSDTVPWFSGYGCERLHRPTAAFAAVR